MQRSIAQLVAALGILKSGAAYLPLDPGHPEERLARLAADARTPVVLTDATTAGLFADSTAAEVLRADTVPDEVSYDGPSPAADQSPDSLVYVIHTSGSTGTPKGAMNTHRSLANRVGWAQRVFGLEPGEAVLHKTPWSFDVSAAEWLWPLTAAARIVLAEPGGHGVGADRGSAVEPRPDVLGAAPPGDVGETVAIRRALGDSAADRVAVTSTKSMTGHLLGGAGAVESMATVLALHEGRIPPTINISELDPEVVVDVVRDKPRDLPGDAVAAINEGFGFGGHNVAVAFRRA